MLKRIAIVLGLTVVFAASFILLRDGVRGRVAGFPRAQPFEAPALSGGELGPQSYPGKVVLVNFWATFCAPCVDEMPSLQKVYDDYHGRGLVVLAVSMDEGLAPVKAFQEKYGIHFPIAHDPGKRISQSYGTDKVPDTYVIARNGEVRYKVMGAVDWTTPEYRRMIEALLTERA